MQKTVDLHSMFKGLQNEMFLRMETVRENVGHAPTMGDEAEAEWIELFQHFLPKRYQADKAFVVDSLGTISEQMDVVIFDRQYSPFMAKLKRANYIPAESVYAVLEAKQDLTSEHIDYAGKKAASVRNLHRTAMPIVHAGGTHQPRKDFTILAGFFCHANGWKTAAFGKPFDGALRAAAPAERLDFGCCLEAGSFFIDWQTGQPAVKTSDKDTALVSFVLGVIAALQRLGTVPALDLNAYLSPMLKKTNVATSPPAPNKIRKAKKS